MLVSKTKKKRFEISKPLSDMAFQSNEKIGFLPLLHYSITPVIPPLLEWILYLGGNFTDYCRFRLWFDIDPSGSWAVEFTKEYLLPGSENKAAIFYHHGDGTPYQ